jgi:hypothetical protein
MDSVNHCVVTRDDLAGRLREAGVDGRVAIPADGAWVDLGG